MGVQIDKLKGVLMHDHEAEDIDGVLKLDQTTPQNVTGGSPVFDEGLTIKADKKLYLDGLSTSLKYNSSTGKIEEEVNGTIVRTLDDPITNYVDYVPSTDNERDIGSSSLAYKDMYIKGNLIGQKQKIVFNLIGTADEQAWVQVPFACTIASHELTADQSGSIVIDLWVDTYCVSEDTEMLTANGWKTYENVREGEMILSFNVDKQKSEWKPIDRINIFDYEGPMFRLGGKQFGALVTPNHRWLVEKQIGRKKIRSKFEIVETKNLGFASSRALIVGGEHNAPINKIYSDGFVELCAWYFTEGNLRPSGKNIIISQSEKVNSDNCRRIEKSLKSVGAVEVFERKDGKKNIRVGSRGSERRVGLYYKKVFKENGCIDYSLSGNRVDDFANVVVGKDKIPTTKFIRQLTNEQLQLFIEVSILGDGTSGTPQFSQHNKARMDAYQMICVLAGYSPKITSDYNVCSLRRRDDGKKPNKVYLNSLTREIELYNGKVWCPTVENHLWFARKDGKAFITGNSNFPPTVADTITASAKPTLSSAQKSTDSTLTGWTKTLSAGDYILANVDSASTLEKAVLTINVTRT
jgi:hypothetical protein